jgi:hypothetical protein
MESRRSFLKKAAYTTPLLLTVAVSPALARNGYQPNGNNGVGNGIDPQPPGDPPINDGVGTGPGNPGNEGGANK